MEENNGVVQPTNETQVEAQNQENQVTETKVEDIANEVEIPAKKEPEIQPNQEKKDEEKIEEKEGEKEDEEFNPEEIDLEDEEENEKPNYKDIEGYDLEYIKDVIDFENPEAVEYIKSEMSKLKKAGFTQEQAQLYIDSHLNSYREDEEDERKLSSKEYVVNHLKEKLTKEERMNYKPILSLMNEISSTGAFPKEWIKDAMSNPNLVKILNGIYKHQTNTNKVVEVPTPKQKAYMTPSAAFDKYKDWIVSQPSTTLEKTGEFIEKELKPYILEKDMAQFNQIFKSLLKK